MFLFFHTVSCLLSGVQFPSTAHSFNCLSTRSLPFRHSALQSLEMCYNFAIHMLIQCYPSFFLKAVLADVILLCINCYTYYEFQFYRKFTSFSSFSLISFLVLYQEESFFMCANAYD